ncbi:uncharacterized protein [Anabrus simplex]
MAANDLNQQHQSVSDTSRCCVRHEKYEHIQHGLPDTVDVGHCRRSCRRSGMNVLSNHSGTEEKPETCPEDWLCRPASSHLQRVSTFRGIREVAVVDTCECRQKPAVCSREPYHMVVFPDTPYETRLDVGACVGHCHDGGCKPVQSRSVSVAGPNGAQCYNVIEKCGCMGSCYRARQVELVYDYKVEDENDDNSEDDNDSADGDESHHSLSPTPKEVDVGVCVGSCSRKSGGHCADPFWRNNEPCRMWLYANSKQQECGPTGFSVHNYTGRGGQRKELIVISSCGCT